MGLYFNDREIIEGAQKGLKEFETLFQEFHEIIIFTDDDDLINGMHKLQDKLNGIKQKLV